MGHSLLSGAELVLEDRVVGWQTGQEDILVLPMNIHSLIHLCKRCLLSSYYVTDTVASGNTVMTKKDIVPMLRGISKDANQGLGMDANGCSENTGDDPARALAANIGGAPELIMDEH